MKTRHREIKRHTQRHCSAPEEFHSLIAWALPHTHTHTHRRPLLSLAMALLIVINWFIKAETKPVKSALPKREYSGLGSFSLWLDSFRSFGTVAGKTHSVDVFRDMSQGLCVCVCVSALLAAFPFPLGSHILFDSNLSCFFVNFVVVVVVVDTIIIEDKGETLNEVTTSQLYIFDMQNVKKISWLVLCWVDLLMKELTWGTRPRGQGLNEQMKQVID